LCVICIAHLHVLEWVKDIEAAVIVPALVLWQLRDILVEQVLQIHREHFCGCYRKQSYYFLCQKTDVSLAIDDNRNFKFTRSKNEYVFSVSVIFPKYYYTQLGLF